MDILESACNTEGSLEHRHMSMVGSIEIYRHIYIYVYGLECPCPCHGDRSAPPGGRSGPGLALILAILGPEYAAPYCQQRAQQWSVTALTQGADEAWNGCVPV